ncbi:glycosyltransferase family 2 protein [Mucilaginibacter sp.]|uniref:glycosyltransferase family 2 protein n=1 Tax=Mucilaginibacter sp. TaxID=1882438 RepID=UPI0026082ACD|nr:glycosyltransferase family 2 protein [Mucilaginibacter sp.]MDB4919639.1 glycosyl transferase family 2 [Mucilaginibacter sp.]
MIKELLWPWTNAVDNAAYDSNISWPKISIITPSFNQGNFIEETILSVLNQNYPNIEYIIIDGGSDDSTVDIIRKYEQKISYWVSEPDRGQTHAINKGFIKATGAIFAYLNSDDCYYPNTLKLVAESFRDQKDNSKLLIHGYCKNGLDFENLLHANTGVASAEFTARHLTMGYGVVPQPSVFWSANNLKFNEELEFSMDHDYWYKLLNSDYKPIQLPETLSFYREHNAAKGSKLKERMWEEVIRLTMTYISDFPDLKDKVEILGAVNLKLLNYDIQLLNRASESGYKQLTIVYLKLFKLNPILGIKLLRYTIGLYKSGIVKK